MKKALTVVLALALVLSLAACGATAGQPSQTPEATVEPSAAGAPQETAAAVTEEVKSRVQEKLDAGEEVLVGYAVNTLANEALKNTVDNVSGFLEEMGCTVSVVTCEGDTALMISQIENFIEMEVDCIIVAPIDQDAMEDTLLKAMDSGIPVVFNGQYPAYADRMSGGGATNYPELGAQTAKMAMKWADDTYPEGEIHVAVLGFNNTYIFKQIYTAITETLAADSRFVVSYTGEQHNSIDSGYTAAEEAMTMDPDIRLFVCYQDNPGIGVSNYLMSQPSFDLSEFGVFCGSFSDTSRGMVDQSAANESPMRGICYYGVYGAKSQTIMGYDIFYAAKCIMLETVEVPYWILTDIWTYDTVGYDQLINYPENDNIYDS